MILPAEFPETYWQQMSNNPVELFPFDPQSRVIASKYQKKLAAVLQENSLSVNLQVYHRGSSSWGILGKGDIEIGIIPDPVDWFPLIISFSQYYKGLGNLDDEYCRFNDVFAGYEIEIILMKGKTAEIDLTLHEAMQHSEKLRLEYAAVKQKFAYSEREYNRAKDRFFRKVIVEL